MTKTPRDYLKYWKVIRQYYKSRYKISQSDLDVLLFMYDEGRFSRDRFQEFARVLTWDRYRFERLLREGWFETFRRRTLKAKALYQMSHKGLNLVKDIYRKLNGDPIPMYRGHNPMVKKGAKQSEKVYLDLIVEMNKFNQQQRHQPPE